MMAWAEVIISNKLLLIFRCFTNKMVLFGFTKSKAINSSFKDYLTDPYVTFRVTCTAENPTNSEFKSSLQHVGTLFNSKKSLHANITE